MQDTDYGLDDCLEGGGIQSRNLRYHRVLVGGKEFPWPGIADNAKRACIKAAISYFNGTRISVGVAGDLT